MQGRVSSNYTKHFCIEVSEAASKFEKLMHFFSTTILGSTIIFVKVLTGIQSKKDIAKIFDQLTGDGWPVSI
ncbi:hypothetical protein N7540_002140 [Penicillium herquei]|nr:hypothetical protein N7540_002140 [Penicillium herquei]